MGRLRELHAEMEGKGFSRLIKADNGKTYRCRGRNTTALGI
jgi:hypothetical protein